MADGLLIALLLIIFARFADGTLRQWFGAKFLNTAAPNRIGKVVTPIPDDKPGVATGVAEGKLRRPLPGPICGPQCAFGAPRSGGRTHEGIDIGAPLGTRIAAAGDGRVVDVDAVDVGLCGKKVKLDHGAGITTHYCHLDTVAVQVGQRVTAGATIGTVGHTGNAEPGFPHLHFEIRVGGNPIDPDTVVG